MGVFSEYKLSKKSDELKKLIAENPNLPIVVLAGEECNSGDYAWMFCSSIRFRIVEILDCEYYDYDDTVFVDRDRLEDVVSERIWDEHEEWDEATLTAALGEKLAELEPYWTRAIAIYANN